MYELPTYIEIDGEPFKIRDNGDFRMVLHCFTVLNAEDLEPKERIIAGLMVFYEDFNTIEDVLSFKNIKQAINELFLFINGGQEEKPKEAPKLIDWEKDSNLICSAINNVAGKEIREEKYIHWWTFLGYYMAIGECALTQIVSIRYKIAKDEKLEKHEKKFRMENPQYFNIDTRSIQQRDAEDYIQSLWDGGND